jgi:subtilase family serine protease
MAKMITTDLLRRMRLLACGSIAACTMMAGAQSLAPRIAGEITNAELSTLKGSLNPLAQAQFDAGRVPADTRLNGVSILFNRTAAQQADLDALIAAQQNPASPLYHQWLTPDAFAARFGVAQSDLDKVQSWLQQQGFSIDSVARSKNIIRFSGTVSQVEQAFSTQMHYYTINGVRHFAPSTALSVPAAIAPTVLSIRNLDDLRPRSHAIFRKTARPRPAFTGGTNGLFAGAVLFAPGDIKTVYDINPVYQGGYNGSGQSITVVGQSAIQLTDIANFQSAAGLTANPPSLDLVPDSGTSTVYADGDEAESDIDIEWSGAIASGANINFVYTGSNPNYGAFDSIIYAIDNKIGTIISSSYGECETELGGQTLETYFQQAASQGQTVMSASGDDGSTDCFIGANSTSPPNPTLAQQEALAVDYPASSAYVTGMGGTEISSTADGGDYLIPGDGYWETAGANDVIDSALKYIPEVAWNDDLANCGYPDCLSASGGGASALFAKPSWQTGVPGIPSDGKRDVPDLALYASPNYPGYLFCSSDQTAWNTSQQPIQESSCTSGFEDSATGNLTIAGGTSFAAPSFAGMLALINQKAGYTTGQGLINPTLYTLAANSATYASAFHDITTGNNDCLAGSADCSSDAGFSAGVGYDQVTGLGSIDVNNLANAWPASTGTSPTLIATTTTITASNSAPLVNVSDNFTISVTAASGTPTGTVSLTVDNNAPIMETLASNGTYVYATSFATAGSHTILAAYEGDSTYAASTGSVSVNVGVVSTGTGTIALTSTPATLTVAQGSQGTETITVTPAGGYTGTVLLTIPNFPSALNNLCGGFVNSSSNGDGDGVVLVSGTAAATDQMILDTNASDCATEGAIRKSGLRPLSALRNGTTSKNDGKKTAPLAVAFAGLLLAGFLGRHSRKFRSLAGLIALLAVGLGLSACSGINGNSLTNPPQGTYTITVTGQDSATATITATTSFTFVIN